MEESYDVFLSYKSDDVELVRPVAETLMHNGLRVWFNEYAIHDAAFWSDDTALTNAIRQGAARSSSALIFCNNAWANSAWCRIEFESLTAQLSPERFMFIQIPDQPQCSAGVNVPFLKKAQKVAYDGDIGRVLDALNNAHWYRELLQYNLPLPERRRFDWFGKKRAKLNAFRSYLKTPGSLEAPTVDVKDLPGNVSFWPGSFRRKILMQPSGDVMYRYSTTLNGLRALLQVNYFPMQTIGPVSKLVTSSISDDRLVYKELVAHANWWVREGRGNRDSGGELKGVHLAHPPRALVGDTNQMNGHFGATLRIDYGSKLNLVAWVRKYAFFLRQNERTSELDMDFIFYLPNGAQSAEQSLYCGVVGYADGIIRSLELSESKYDKSFGEPSVSKSIYYENRTDIAKLVNEAVELVDRRKYTKAIKVLKRAIEVDPACGDAFNELAFIYGKAMGNLDVAEMYAIKATECDLINPKFLNSIFAIQNARAKSFTSRKAITKFATEQLRKIEIMIQDNSSYPPAYLMKAATLALMGEPRQKWENELKCAEQMYLLIGESATGAPITRDSILDIIQRNRKECLENSGNWMYLLP